METKKILKSKIKKNTILSVFDNIQDKPITLLKWIKSIYKNCKIERIEVQYANKNYTIKKDKIIKEKRNVTKLKNSNDYGFILTLYFLDGSYLQTPTIKVATEEVVDGLVQALEEELNARELADSELQHDIDNHTNNNTIHVTQQDKDNWNTGRSPLYLHKLYIEVNATPVKSLEVFIINTNYNELDFETLRNNINKIISGKGYYENNLYPFYELSFIGSNIQITYINNNFQFGYGIISRNEITTFTDTVTEL